MIPTFYGDLEEKQLKTLIKYIFRMRRRQKNGLPHIVGLERPEVRDDRRIFSLRSFQIQT